MPHCCILRSETDSGALPPATPTAAFTTAEEGLRVVDEVIALMGACAYGSRDRFDVRLILEEAVVNAVKHGNRNDPSKIVRVRFHVTPEQVLLEVEDEG